MIPQRASQFGSVRLDGDDFADVLAEVEASFEISLPNNLMHIATVGDLFEEILQAGRPDEHGEGCDTAMAFYRLCRVLMPLGLDRTAGPTTALAGQELPSPRKIRQLLKHELGLASPGIVVSRAGCILACAIIIAVFSLALAKWSPDWLGLWLVVLPVLGLDRGGWKGDWETLGSLSRAIAVRNVAALAHQGARNRETDWWRSFAQLIAATVFDEQDRPVEWSQLARTTRFEFA